jgi:hypothetical protein
VGLFSKRKSSEPLVTGPPRYMMASGRRLKSSLDAEPSVNTLNAAAHTYSEPPYEHTPLVTPVGYTWLGDEPPTQVVGFDDVDKYILIAALWERSDGTDIGLFPLGKGDDRIQGMPVVGYMKKADPSLSSTGTYPERLFALIPPRLTDDYFADFLMLGNLPVSPHNMALLDSKVAGMFKIKAWELIKSKDQRMATRFVDEHESSSAQEVLDALGRWNPGVVAYIQGLPYRVRGIALSGDGAAGADGFWGDFERY